MGETDASISKIFNEVKSGVERKETAEKEKKLRTEQLLKDKKEKTEAKEREIRQALKRLFEASQSNFAEMAKNPKIKEFLKDKFEKREKEKELGFIPYFQYMVGNSYFPAYVIVTQEYKLKMIPQWWQGNLSRGKEFRDAVRVFTALGSSKKSFIEFLLKDWSKKAKYIGRTHCPANYP